MILEIIEKYHRKIHTKHRIDPHTQNHKQIQHLHTDIQIRKEHICQTDQNDRDDHLYLIHKKQLTADTVGHTLLLFSDSIVRTVVQRRQIRHILVKKSRLHFDHKDDKRRHID